MVHGVSLWSARAGARPVVVGGGASLARSRRNGKTVARDARETPWAQTGDELEDSVATTDNWGRWGAEDERGTLNLLTPETVLAATQVCKTGKVYSLAMPIQREGAPIFDYRGAPQRLSLTSCADAGMYDDFGAARGARRQRGRLRDRVALDHAHGRAVARVRREQDVQRLRRRRRSPRPPVPQKLDITKTG